MIVILNSIIHILMDSMWPLNMLSHPTSMGLLRGCLYHGSWSCPMLDGIFPWSHFIVTLPWFNFFKCILKAFGPLTRCKPNVDQEKWPCTEKWMCWFFLNICPKRVILATFFMFDLLPMTFVAREHFCISHCKTRWIMRMDNVGLKIGLLGPQVSWSSLTFLFFLDVNRSGPMTSSMVNHIFLRSKGRVHVHDVSNPLRDTWMVPIPFQGGYGVMGIVWFYSMQRSLPDPIIDNKESTGLDITLLRHANRH